MTPAARLSAAIEVLADIEARRRPAPDALKDWGLSHRFAGSGDRAAIASLVYDTLRRRASAAWLMGEATPRAVLLGALHLARGLSSGEIAALCSGERFAPSPLTDDELSSLDAGSLGEAPAPVAGDFPDWIAPSLARAFGEDMVAEMQALAERAPLDLRVNLLKSQRDAVAADIAVWSPTPTPLSPWGLRLRLGPDGRGPSVQSDPVFLRGEVEIQDEGSQLAALLSGALPGETVVDLCAGGGGKTLALGAMMGGRGRLLATDADPRRLAPIHARLARAGVEAEVRTPRGKQDALADLDAGADLVVVDAPCTGTGTWRRNPDAKWRLRAGSLSLRVSEQAKVLDRAAQLARPGGRIAYITCSVLPEENDDAVAAFLHRHRGAEVEQIPEAAPLAHAVRTTRYGLQMTPLRTGTDGFYVARLRC
ncbi:RsmB/NOP family class I SAM-dependent RNA methyltransferase [Enterovirga rhinocerotis]|uniref:16S rRNA (Cytosine967-C5)-methyltransferase n=1 Tax=Enterovirga rhinocerotis TaxID=1339210 RepID=A0A4R7C9C8_9HYPH|nr:RsmB/NOP family class I SAM-dependent RNA methyltransferase [Enterovirga rhinocerotis]TDR93945.1 16S rRNA (cytosine967-C5)-methyltransferase [Enterovirga rhinocerotis]